MTGRRQLLALCAAAMIALGGSGCGGSSGHISVTVTPASATTDVPFDIRVTGLRAHQRATIDFSGRSTAGLLWQGSRSVQADAKGVVSLANDYVLAQMRHPGSNTYPGQEPYPAEQAAFPRSVRITVAGISTVAERHPVAVPALVTPERPSKVGFYGNWERPRSVRDHTTILLFGGSEGGLSGRYLAAALVAHGYPVLDIAYFDEPGLPKRLLRIRLEYFEHALRWLATQPEVDPKRIISFGVSRGGELSLILASTFPDLIHGAVGYVPYFEAVPSPWDGQQPAWTYRGQGVLGTIPVEKIAGPVFVAGGEQDGLWPSGAATHSIADRMHEHGRHDVTALDYRLAGHELGLVLPVQRLASGADYASVKSAYGQLYLGGSPRPDETAREDAWPKVLAFLAGIEN
jgi:dienelactone hydrolase